MRPIGQGDAKNISRQSNVGDGRKLSAGVLALKARVAAAAPGATAILAATSVPPVAQAIVDRAARLASALKLPLDFASFAALAAMLGERLPLDAGSVAAVRRAARRRDDDPAAARIAARAIAAGLDPDGVEVEGFLSVLATADGGSSADDGGMGSRYDGAPGGRGRHGDPGSPRPPTTPAVDIAALSDSIESSAAKALLDGDCASLSAPEKDGGAWLCIPFETLLGELRFHGFMRIRYDAASCRAERLVADIRLGEERRIVDIGGGERRSIRYHADDERERVAFEESFSRFGFVSTASVASGDLAEFGEYSGVDEHA